MSPVLPKTIHGRLSHLWHAGEVGQCAVTNPLGACPASTTGTLVVRNMAEAPAREIRGSVTTEVEPAGDAGRAVAQNGLNG